MNTLFNIAFALTLIAALTMAYDLLINKRHKRLPRIIENIATSSFLVGIMLWIVYLLCSAFIAMGF